MANWKKVLVSGSQIEVAGITGSNIGTAPGTVGTSKVLIQGSDGEFYVTGSGAIGGGGTTTATLTRGNGLSGANFDGSVGTTFAVSASGTTLDVSANGVKVKDLGIDTAQLAADAVTTVKITDLNVTHDKLALNAVETDNIKDEAVTTAKIDTSLGTLANNEFTGSFTGSFDGDGSNLTGVTNASTTANLTEGTAPSGITDFTFNGGTAATVSISGAAALSTEKLVKWSGDAFVDSKITEGTNTISVGTVSDTTTFNGNVIVAGTASFQNEETLLVKDRYILLNSGSTSGDQGGLIVQTAGTQNKGQLFGYQDASSRWAVTSSFNAGATGDFTAAGFMGLTSASTAANPNTSNVTSTEMKQKGNIFVDSTDGIWIYS
tara:strand:+ start:6208 stop:7338 length:1131 start_codon:yes stop_codon:yes gene_type:complete